MLLAGRAGAQERVPCVRLRFTLWSPALEWARAGHPDSAQRLGQLQRQARDSVYAGSATTQGRDEMQWGEVNGRTQLTVFPLWWPAGIAITFGGRIAAWHGVTDTLPGDAVAYVADAGTRPPRSTALVVRSPCD